MYGACAVAVVFAVDVAHMDAVVVAAKVAYDHSSATQQATAPLPIAEEYSPATQQATATLPRMPMLLMRHSIATRQPMAISSDHRNSAAPTAAAPATAGGGGAGGGGAPTDPEAELAAAGLAIAAGGTMGGGKCW